MIGKNRPSHRWIVAAGAALLFVAGVRGGDSETRDYTVHVDGKPAGTASITIQPQNDGSTLVATVSNVMVKILFKKYTYTCQTREVWKNGRLQQVSGQCNDDGKQYQVSATTQNDGVHIRVNGRERVDRPEIWTTTYWTLPDAKIRNQVIPVLDIDNGSARRVRLQHVGAVQIAVAGQVQNVQHYRLTGTSGRVELFYDAKERLVRQEWVEEGHPTILELKGIRR